MIFTSWLNLNSVVLSKGSQKQNITHSIILFIWNSMRGKNNLVVESRSATARVQWVGGGNWLQRSKWELVGMKAILHLVTEEAILQLYAFDKTHKIRHFKRADFACLKKSIGTVFLHTQNPSSMQSLIFSLVLILTMASVISEKTAA